MLADVRLPSFSSLGTITSLLPYLSEELATGDCLPTMDSWSHLGSSSLFSGISALGFVTREKVGQQEAKDPGYKQLAQAWYYNTDEPNKRLVTIERDTFPSFFPVSFTSNPCFPHLLCPCSSLFPAHRLLPFISLGTSLIKS